MKVREMDALKAQMTLSALVCFKGQRNHSSLHFCAMASEFLTRYFAEEQIAQRSKRAADNNQAMLTLMCVSKLLGLIEGEPAGVPDTIWQTKMKQRLRESDPRGVKRN